jgi:hypothetical protein
MVNPTGASTVAAGSGGAMSIMDQAKDTLAPYADTIRYIQYFLLGLAVVGLSFAVYGFWRRNKVDSAM